MSLQGSSCAIGSHPEGPSISTCLEAKALEYSSFIDQTYQQEHIGGTCTVQPQWGSSCLEPGVGTSYFPLE